MKARIKAKYKGISIQGTQTTETYTGTATEWQYIYPGDKYSAPYVRDSKILELTPQASHENYTLVRIGTVSGILFDHVNSLAELREALDDYSSGVIGHVSTDSVNDVSCGPTIHLIDLL